MIREEGLNDSQYIEDFCVLSFAVSKICTFSTDTLTEAEGYFQVVVERDSLKGGEAVVLNYFCLKVQIDTSLMYFIFSNLHYLKPFSFIPGGSSRAGQDSSVEIA